jgi:hypothetical protein
VGISIAPLQYSKLSDIELERVIRNELINNPYIIGRRIANYTPTFKIVDKNVHGPRLVSKRNYSLLKFEQDWE